jgi:hypothetical protein
MIRAITTLADALGMETLAEGVEDQGQADILRREGCRQIQGYLLSQPVSSDQVAGLIRAWRHRAASLARRDGRAPGICHIGDARRAIGRAFANYQIEKFDQTRALLIEYKILAAMLMINVGYV